MNIRYRPAAIVVLGTMIQTTVALGGAPRPDETYAPVNVRGATGLVMQYARDGRPHRLYGAAFSNGATPAASAEAFIAANANLLGVTRQDLGASSTTPVMFQRDIDHYRFTLVAYDQRRSGIPVFRGRMKLLVRNEPGFPLVWVNPAVRDVNAFDPDVEVVGEDVGAGHAAAHAFEPRLDRFGAAELVVWAGVDGDLVEPKVAWQFIGEGGAAGDADYARVLFLTDATTGPTTGTILFAEDQVLHVDIEGSVSGLVTEGLGADLCGPEVPTALPYARVTAGGSEAYADEGGNFVIPFGGTEEVTVESGVAGRYFRVDNRGGPDSVLAVDVTPPGPVHFLHNPVNDDEFTRAEVNAYVHANVARDYLLHYHPTYPTIHEEEGFLVNVNWTGGCNGSYTGTAINLHRSGGACPNTGFSGVVHHEYAHHIIEMSGSGQAWYGEAMSDAFANLVIDDPGTAYGFYGNCEIPIRTSEQFLTYPCSGTTHQCAPLLSGAIWDVRNELVATNPDTYRDLVSLLTINSILLHTGREVTPAIALDFLTLDDDDGDLYNGTPHYDEIFTGFTRHHLTPPLEFLSFFFADDLPRLFDPGGTTTFDLTVTAANGVPQPGTGVLHWDTGGGAIEIPMEEIEPNVYRATLPATECPTDVEYFFSRETTTGFLQLWPIGAPAAHYEAVAAADYVTTFADDFETDTGWEVINDETLEDGAWERGVPAGGGDQGDPPRDGDGSGRCYVTGNAPGQDVDRGFTRLLSPIMDASDPDSYLEFDVWVHTEGTNDALRIDVSDDGGTTFEFLTTLGLQPQEGRWERWQYRVAPMDIRNTDRFRVRFSATDNNPASTVEFGVDAVRMRVGYVCEAPCPADLDGSGDVGFDDLLLLLSAWGPCPECPEDLNDDDDVGFDDLLLLLTAWGACE